LETSERLLPHPFYKACITLISVGSGTKRQMSEWVSHPHEEHYEPCTLRGETWPHKSAGAEKQNALKVVSPL
jgi:hypothetical protein